MFLVHIQVCNGGKVIASEKIAPYRKNVLDKSGKTVGGGDEHCAITVSTCYFIRTVGTIITVFWDPMPVIG